MKRFIILLFLCFEAMICLGQSLQYTKIIPAEGKSAAELFSLSKQWVSVSFNQPKKVIQVEDEASKFVSCSAALDYKINTLTSCAGWVDYTFTLTCRDGRVKMDILNLNHTASLEKGTSLGIILDVEEQFTSGLYKKFKNDSCKEIKDLFAAFTELMANSLESFYNGEGKDDDW